MILAPGMLGAQNVIVLKADEKLPTRWNRIGVLVYQQGPEGMQILKTKDKLLSPEETV